MLLWLNRAKSGLHKTFFLTDFSKEIGRRETNPANKLSFRKRHLLQYRFRLYPSYFLHACAEYFTYKNITNLTLRFLHCQISDFPLLYLDSSYLATESLTFISSTRRSLQYTLKSNQKNIFGQNNFHEKRIFLFAPFKQ